MTRSTTEKLATQPIDPKQVKTVSGRGGEILKIAGFTIEPILGRHGEPPTNIVGPIDAALKEVTKPLTEEEAAEQNAIRQRGTSDRRVTAEGTIAYLITLEDGFRIMYRDSGGRVTEQEKAAMERVGRIDLNCSEDTYANSAKRWATTQKSPGTSRPFRRAAIAYCSVWNLRPLLRRPTQAYKLRCWKESR